MFPITSANPCKSPPTNVSHHIPANVLKSLLSNIPRYIPANVHKIPAVQCSPSHPRKCPQIPTDHHPRYIPTNVCQIPAVQCSLSHSCKYPLNPRHPMFPIIFPHMSSNSQCSLVSHRPLIPAKISAIPHTLKVPSQTRFSSPCTFPSSLDVFLIIVLWTHTCRTPVRYREFSGTTGQTVPSLPHCQDFGNSFSRIRMWTA